MKICSASFLAGGCFLTSSVVNAALPKCAHDLRVNWFHLQENTVAWNGLSSGVAREWKLVADKLRNAIPSSKFGVALFGAAKPEYKLVSDLSANLDASKIEKAFGRSKEPAHEWPLTLESVQNITSGSVKSLSPLVWATLHSAWDESPKTHRFITIAQASPPRLSVEESKETSHDLKGKLKAFNADVYPASAPKLWPAGLQPRLSTDRAEPTLEMIKDVLDKRGIHLIINAGAVEGGSAIGAWEDILAEVGQKSTDKKSLYYLPGSLKSPSDRNLSTNIITGMEAVLGCSLRSSRRLLEDQAAVAEEDCENVCECHSVECRPCCKKGDKVILDIVDEPSHLNVSMGHVN